MSSARPSIVEVQLAAAVIQRGLDDAVTPDQRLASERLIKGAGAPRKVWAPGLRASDRDEAVRFLLSPSGLWAESRREWCDIAGIDAGAVRARALKVIPRSSIPPDLRRALRLPDPLAVSAVEAPPPPVVSEPVSATALQEAA